MFALLAGNLPFDENNIPALFSNIKAARYDIPHHFSVGARDLIKRMLNNDPITRITIKQIMEHPWYKSHIPLHLKYTESIVDNDVVDCLGALSPNKSNREISEEIISKCLEYPEFKGFQNNKDELKERIIRRKQDPFTVTYEILLDQSLKHKRKVLNRSHIKVEPVFREKLGSFRIPDDETMFGSNDTQSTTPDITSYPMPHN